MKIYLFPGQGSQYTGMGKELYQSSELAKTYFNKANNILGFDIKRVMFEGSEEELKQTKVTQPSIFLHSVVRAMLIENFEPLAVAGHSLGEFSALTAAGVLSFEDGLSLVAKRAQAMQEACEKNPSTMAAILGLENRAVEDVCRNIEGVVPANYNAPEQLVISGTYEAVEKACAKLKEKGAKRAIQLAVGGAFHSPLMQGAEDALAEEIQKTTFNDPICPIYQNVDARKYQDPEIIKKNLLAQLTSPVQWRRSMLNMVADGGKEFVECGPGKVLQTLLRKTNIQVKVSGVS